MVKEWSVNGQLAELLLCEVAPGSERQVLHHFRKLKVPVFLSFAEFNLIAAIPTSRQNFAQDPHLDVATRLREIQEVLCFHWEHFSETLDDLEKIGPAVLFTFLKIDETTVRKYGLQSEFAVLDWLEKERSRLAQLGISVVPYGSFGWYEFVLILGGASFGPLITEVLRFRELALRDIFDTSIVPSESESLLKVIADTHSIPCVTIPPNVDNPYDALTIQQITESVSPRILVASAAAQYNELMHKVQTKFGKTFNLSTTFGYYDSVIEPSSRTISLASLAELLKYLRDPDECPSVLTTQIVLSQEISIKPPHNTITHSNSPAQKIETHSDLITSANNLLERLRDFEHTLENSQLGFYTNLSRIIRSYVAFSGIREMEGLTDDLDSFIESLLRRVENIIEESKPSVDVGSSMRTNYELLEDVHILFKFGFDQRMSGAQIGLTNAGRGYTGIHPIGIQRIIGAASATPRYLFSAKPGLANSNLSRLSWNGFMVLGFSADTLRLDEGVINLPASLLLDPAEWWMLSHEIGHEIFAQMDLPNNNSAFHRGIVEATKVFEHISPGFSIDEGKDFATELCEELMAEYYSFVTFFASDWRFYMETMWKFLQDYLEGRDSKRRLEEFLVRATFVLFAHLESEKALESIERIDDVIRRGHDLGNNIMAPDQDSPGYTETAGTTAQKNLALRGLGEFDSVEDIVKHEIIEHAMLLAPKLRAELSDVSISTIVALYQSFEITRHEVCQIIAEITQLSHLPVEKKPSLERFIQTLRDIARLWEHPRKYLMPSARKDLYQSLAKGKIQTTETANPLELIAALKQARMKLNPNEDDWSRAIVACILSLWDYDRKQLGREKII